MAKTDAATAHARMIKIPTIDLARIFLSLADHGTVYPRSMLIGRSNTQIDA
jgi:hypothetical protein